MEALDLHQWPGFVAAGGNLSELSIIDQVVVDSRRIDSSRALFVALPGESHDGHEFIIDAAERGARFALVRADYHPQASVGNLTLLRVSNPLRALQEIAAAYRQTLDAKVIAITGSYGKTMVKDLLTRILGKTKRTMASPESFNSQIGVALSLFKIKKTDEFAIIEAGISEPNEMDFLAQTIQPDYGILTTVGKAHLSTLGSLQTTAIEKMKLFRGLPETNWMILPKQDIVLPLVKKGSPIPYYWNVSQENLPHATPKPSLIGGTLPYIIEFPNGYCFEGHTHADFPHALDVINIGVKAAWLLGLPSEAISEALRDYSPEPMHREIWRSPFGATFINDAYCSDPLSIHRSLRQIRELSPGGRKLFVFGGMRDPHPHSRTDYRHIAQAIKQAHIDILFLVGHRPFHLLIEEVSTYSPSTQILSCPDRKDIVQKMHALINKDDTVLIKGPSREFLESLSEDFSEILCDSKLSINLGAIRSNVDSIRNKLAKGTRLMVMVKAMAYGTDAIFMAKFLAHCGVDILGVAYPDEATALRRSGVTQEIFVINAAPYEIPKLVKGGFQVGVSNLSFIQTLESEASVQNRKIKVHLHIDSGMSRLGCRPEEALALAQQITKSPFLILEGVMTHFSSADDPNEDAFTQQQAERLRSVISSLKSNGISPPWLHASNSSAMMRFDFPEFNMARVGLAVFGLYPSEVTRGALDMLLAVSLTTRIAGINICRKGDTISYGRTYKAVRDEERIGVLPLGYFDGMHRQYSGKGYVLVRGHKAPLVGTICMDFMMIDVTDVPNASIGDRVLVFGEDEYGNQLSPESLAAQGKTTAYELLTCLGPRVQRIFVSD